MDRVDLRRISCGSTSWLDSEEIESIGVGCVGPFGGLEIGGTIKSFAMFGIEGGGSIWMLIGELIERPPSGASNGQGKTGGLKVSKNPEKGK